MKKIITLLLAVGAFAAADAQTTKDEARRVILGDGGNTTTTRDNGKVRSRDVILGDDGSRRNYPNSGTSANQINREYDAKINSIRNNPTLSSQEKERIIRDLEKERQRKLKKLNGDYNKGKKHKDYKSNPGKHKGWTKGKGNKHRDRD